MRHGKKFNHLGRKAPHRKAMLANMACSLIQHKRIKTTVAKAKALRVYIEPLLTKSKNDTTHSRRTVFSYLKQKEAITELFGDVAAKIADRPGGYTRILRISNRLGDNAEMCFIELVDYNDDYTTDKPKRKKTRRRGKSTNEGHKVEGVAVEAVVNEEVVEATSEEITDDVKETVIESKEEVQDAVEEQVEESPTTEVIEQTAQAEEETTKVEVETPVEAEEVAEETQEEVKAEVEEQVEITTPAEEVVEEAQQEEDDSEQEEKNEEATADSNEDEKKED